MPRRWPHPRERFAESFREAEREEDRARPGRYERAGFGSPEGYRGAYAERWRYTAPRGVLYPPEPEGSGWPHPRHSLTSEEEERHLRAMRDRDLARSVDCAIYNAIGPDADRIAVYASDAEVTLEGRVPHPRLARAALEVAWRTPGVRRVRNALSWRR